MADKTSYTAQDQRIQSAPGAVTLAAATLTTVATIPVGGRTLLAFHFNVAVRAVDDLQVYAKAHPDAEYVDITPTSATWANPATPSWRIKNSAVHTTSTGAYVDADLNTVDTTENGYLEVDVTGLHEVVIKASCATDNTGTLTPRWQLT
jgi:hypothetical protein